MPHRVPCTCSSTISAAIAVEFDGAFYRITAFDTEGR